ncbi:MAG: SPOR domain-containing protein [Ignavibacteria bacterium]|nr:SPOR domain-containing protein [Ignavibacteria bacterium]
MALKIDKKLFDEKVYGGFEPTDPDDDTFLLEKLGKYPDELPYEIETSTSQSEYLDKFGTNDTINEVNQEVPSKSQQTAEPFHLESTSKFEDSTEPSDFEGRTTVPYEKSGIEKEKHESIPYQKLGLVESEPVVPFERSGIEREKKNIPEAVESKPVGSIWEIFEEGTSQSASEISPQVTAEDQTVDIKKESTEEPSAGEVPKEEKTQTILIGTDSIVDIPLEIKVQDISPEEISKIFDEDFRKTIIDDLEKSQKRRAAKTSIEEAIISTREKEELQEELDKLDEVVPQPSKTVEIDISALELAKPSQIIASDLIASGELEKKKKKKRKKEKKIEKEAPKALPTETEQTSLQEIDTEPSVVEFETKEEETTPETKPDEEKKRRKVPFLWFAIAGGLALIILVIGGYFAYLSFFKPKEKPKEIVKKEVPPKKVETKQEQPKIAQEPKPQVPEDVPTKQQTTEIIKPKEEIIDKSQKQVPQTTVKEEKTPSPETTEKQKDTKIILSKKEKEQEQNQKEKPKIIPQEVKIVELPQEEYSIEIFSTADPDEAGYWLNQLQSRGLNAYQKVHKIRNIQYYKIRIGSYRSIDEAKSVARALGFKKIWIDRVK